MTPHPAVSSPLTLVWIVFPSFHQELNSACWSLPGQNPVLTHHFTLSSQNKYRNTFNFKPQQKKLFEKHTNAGPCDLLQQSLQSLVKRDFAVTHTARTAHKFQRLRMHLGSEAENNHTYVDPHVCEILVFSEYSRACERP